MSKWVRPPITEATMRRRARLAKAQDGICPACQLPLPEDLSETEIDHIIPRVRGGPEDAWNKRLVHFICNRSKRFKLTDEAVALAAEHGVILREPVRAYHSRHGGGGWVAPLEERRQAVALLRASTANLTGGKVNGTPWQLGVRCDRPGCAVAFEGDFLVAEDSTRDDRLRVVLKHAESIGWRVESPQGSADADEAATFCPSCAKIQESA